MKQKRVTKKKINKQPIYLSSHHLIILSLTPFAISIKFKPLFVTSNTHISVIIRFTTFLPVNGNEHVFKILCAPPFAVCSIVTTTRLPELERNEKEQSKRKREQEIKRKREQEETTKSETKHSKKKSKKEYGSKKE